jgi:hypothetical protein
VIGECVRVYRTYACTPTYRYDAELHVRHRPRVLAIFRLSSVVLGHLVDRARRAVRRGSMRRATWVSADSRCGRQATCGDVLTVRTERREATTDSDMMPATLDISEVHAICGSNDLTACSRACFSRGTWATRKTTHLVTGRASLPDIGLRALEHLGRISLSALYRL